MVNYSLKFLNIKLKTTITNKTNNSLIRGEAPIASGKPEPIHPIPAPVINLLLFLIPMIVVQKIRRSRHHLLLQYRRLLNSDLFVCIFHKLINRFFRIFFLHSSIIP